MQSDANKKIIGKEEIEAPGQVGGQEKSAPSQDAEADAKVVSPAIEPKNGKATVPTLNAVVTQMKSFAPMNNGPVER